MSSEFYSARVRYTKQLDNGTFKRVSEPYLFRAMSYTDAEARIYQEIAVYVRGEFLVTNIKKEKFVDILNIESDAELIFKVVVTHDVYNDDGETKKKIKNVYAVKANSIEESIALAKEYANRYVDMGDNTVTLAQLTDIVEFLEDNEDVNQTESESESEKLVPVSRMADDEDDEDEDEDMGQRPDDYPKELENDYPKELENDYPEELDDDYPKDEDL